MDIEDLLRPLPTKEDIKSMVTYLEESFQRQNQEIGELTEVASQVEEVSVALATYDARLQALENIQHQQAAQILDLQLHIEDLAGSWIEHITHLNQNQ